MKLKKLTCKLLGHKKGFLHKHEDHYHYVCLRCEEEVVEEIIYDKHETAGFNGAPERV